VTQKSTFDNDKKTCYTQITFTNYLYFMSKEILTPSNNPQAFQFREDVINLASESSRYGFTTTKIFKEPDSKYTIFGKNHGFFMQGSEKLSKSETEMRRGIFSVNVGHTNAMRDYLLEHNPEKREKLQNVIIAKNQKIKSTILNCTYETVCFQDFSADNFYLTKSDFYIANAGENNLQRISQEAKYNATFVPSHNFSTNQIYIESGTLTLSNLHNTDHQNISIIPDDIIFKNQDVRIVQEPKGQFEIAYNTAVTWSENSDKVYANAYGSWAASHQKRMATNLYKIRAFRKIAAATNNAELTCVQDGNLYGKLINSTEGLKKTQFVIQLVAKIVSLGKISPNAEGELLQKLLYESEFDYLMPKDFTFMGESKIQELAMKILRYRFDAAIVNYPAVIRAILDGYDEFDHRPTVVLPQL
jgi:hypothetical protein